MWACPRIHPKLWTGFQWTCCQKHIGDAADMTTRFVLKESARRRSDGIYIDGIGLHQCGLPIESHDGLIHTLAMGDNNHAISVQDDRIEVTTRIQTALSLYMQGLLGKAEHIHRLAVGAQEVGEGMYVGLQLTDDNRHDRIRLLFRRIRSVTP